MDYKKNKELIKLEHKYKMEFGVYLRETERLKHEWEKERIRIKSAEIRKAYDRRWLESHSHDKLQ